jgi:hypothetical protein
LFGGDVAGFHEGGEVGFLDDDPAPPSFRPHAVMSQPLFSAEQVNQAFREARQGRRLFHGHGSPPLAAGVAFLP